VDRSIRAGITGAIMAVVINGFSPIPLYFIPSFLAAILVIILFRLGTLKDGLIVAFMTYLFNVEILSFLAAAQYYNTAYTIPLVGLDIVLSPIFDLITALIAGLVGPWLVHRMKPAPPSPEHELPPPMPKPLPPV
jgi:hypothetical protein